MVLMVQSPKMLEANFLIVGFPTHRAQLLMRQTPLVLNLEGYLLHLFFFQFHGCDCYQVQWDFIINLKQEML